MTPKYRPMGLHRGTVGKSQKVHWVRLFNDYVVEVICGSMGGRMRVEDAVTVVEDAEPITCARCQAIEKVWRQP